MRELGAQLFQDLRRLAENGINPRLNDRLDGLLDRPFDWSMKEATGTTSGYLKETFQFLEETFEKLRVLKMSDQLISEAIFATYQHIGRDFHSLGFENLVLFHDLNQHKIPKQAFLFSKN
jgi:hypothetical protein